MRHMRDMRDRHACGDACSAACRRSPRQALQGHMTRATCVRSSRMSYVVCRMLVLCTSAHAHTSRHAGMRTGGAPSLVRVCYSIYKKVYGIMIIARAAHTNRGSQQAYTAPHCDSYTRSTCRHARIHTHLHVDASTRRRVDALSRAYLCEQACICRFYRAQSSAG